MQASARARLSNQAVKLRRSVGACSAVDTTVNSCRWFLAPPPSVQRARGGGGGAAVKYAERLIPRGGNFVGACPIIFVTSRRRDRRRSMSDRSIDPASRLRVRPTRFDGWRRVGVWRGG